MTRIVKKIALIAVTYLAGSALATNEGSTLSRFETIRAMKKVFARSEQAHRSSMAAITQRLTSPDDALAALKENNQTTSALLQVADLAVANHRATRARGGLRRKPKKLSGLSGARHMLNNMIFESSSKYDGEIAKCTEFYSKQCGLMQIARGEIAASNYLAANARMSILSSQGSISRCEDNIPTKKLELKEHNQKCRHEVGKMNTRLKIILGDIAVMTMILKMTECSKKNLMQIGMMKCKDRCTKNSFISFKHESVRKQFAQLQSSSAHELTHEVMSDLFDGVGDLENLEFVADPVVPNKTTLSTIPMPRTEVASNPCNDPNMGAPSSATKRAAKCTIAKSPQCPKLQERFLLVQAGIQDEKDDLMEEVRKTEDSCQETKDTLETQIMNDEATLGNAQTKLAAATEDEATAGESARQTSKSFNGMNSDLVRTMKTCNTNYINFETELCALKKIRGELYKMAGKSAVKLFFVDCEVAKWESEECSRECGGGTQKLVRGVIAHPNRGAKCLPLEAVRSCNLNPCSVDCKLHQWSGWSKCSAECGGGVEQRLRDVKRAMRFGGKPCGATSETKACNAQACEKDCTLGSWTKWSDCSKDCDGGTQKRERFIKEVALGEGDCASKWDPERLEYKHCNTRRCMLPDKVKVLPCKRKLDVVLLMDGSGSLKKEGWKAVVAATRNFISAFSSKHSHVKMSVILFSGPKNFANIGACVGNSKKPLSAEKCGIKTVTHFTDDMKKVDDLVKGLDYPKGGTLTSMALATAKAELSLGRKSAQSVVVVLTDGRPYSTRKTLAASTQLRKTARLIWVAITTHAPLAFLKSCATRRWQENIVVVKTFEQLKTADPINQLIANMCPAPHVLPVYMLAPP